jgi:hypothetical protein
MQKQTLKAARETVVIGQGNSKMPGTVFSTDAFACKVGSKLAKVKGSVCHGCYARKLQKLRPAVDKGWKNNYARSVKNIAENFDRWTQDAAFQIIRQSVKTGVKYHRWFDSGDLDSVDMLRAIVEVCKITHDTKHWLPTREAKIVQEYRKKYGPEPDNLIIRISATMIGDKPITGHEHTSTVHRKGEQVYGHECLAPQQDNECKDCRACWSKDVTNVSYKKH